MRNSILSWIDKYLDQTDYSRWYGKGLIANPNPSGEWRYRVGDYRILANILDDKIIIEVLSVGHRRDID
ncbi:mRNA interferase RelE/StbE [Streptococcus rupicaprae]|uniref:mRNA interferase RelE/StbE n=1 Tax=Streptococcus rupicaprae TaxID=759619 RepID=A0ABV2FKT1_9STRE